jgi:hypothetical protein
MPINVCDSFHGAEHVRWHSRDATRAQGKPGVRWTRGRDQVLKRLRVFRGRLPSDFKLDRDDANAR